MQFDSSFFTKANKYRLYVDQMGAWWLLLGPGLVMIIMSIAIFIAPAFFAYMVAFFMLFGGSALTFWGWTLRQREQDKLSRRVREHDGVRYEIL